MPLMPCFAPRRFFGLMVSWRGSRGQPAQVFVDVGACGRGRAGVRRGMPPETCRRDCTQRGDVTFAAAYGWSALTAVVVRKSRVISLAYVARRRQEYVATGLLLVALVTPCPHSLRFFQDFSPFTRDLCCTVTKCYFCATLPSVEA